MMTCKYITDENLQFAFDEFVLDHGREKALAALEGATGTRDLAAIPDTRRVNAMAALVRSGILTGPRSRMAVRGKAEKRTPAAVLNEMAARIYGAATR